MLKIKEQQTKTSLEVVKKEEKAVSEIPSLEKRIQKVEDLSMLIEKWRKLTETCRNLQTFSLGLMVWGNDFPQGCFR